MKRVSFLILLFTIFLLACSLLEDTVSNTPAPVASPTAVAISLGDSTLTSTPDVKGTPVVRATPTTIATPPGLLTVNSLTTPDVSVTSSHTAANTQKISSGTVDLKVTGFELTQGVSDEPLLLGKATVARVRVSLPSDSNVEARVTLQVNSKSYSGQGTLIGPESTINLKIDDPAVLETINVRATVNPVSPVTDSRAEDNTATATYQTVQAPEKVSVFFLPVDWSESEMNTFDFNNAFKKFAQDNADFFAGAYPLAKNGLIVNYTLTPHMLSTFEKTLADSQGKFSYRNALALYGSISIVGRRYQPNATIVVGVMPPRWFKNHGRAGTLGLTLREVKGTVTGEFDATDPTTAAHEVGHLYNLYEDYDYAVEPPRPGVEINAPEFWVQRYREMTSSSTARLWTFLSSGSSKVVYWADNRIYDFLLARFALNGGRASAPLILAATMDWEIEPEGNPADYSAGILRFEPKQPIFVSVAGISLNAGSKIEARLFRGNSQISTLTQTASAGNKWYAFTLSKDGSLSQAQYHVDIYLDGTRVKSSQFEVKASK